MFSKIDEERIIKLREKFSLSQDDIADIFNCSQATIHNVFKRNHRKDLGNSPDNLIYKQTKNNLEEFSRQILEGNNWWEVDIEVSKCTLKRYAKRLGVYKNQSKSWQLTNNPLDEILLKRMAPNVTKAEACRILGINQYSISHWARVRPWIKFRQDPVRRGRSPDPGVQIRNKRIYKDYLNGASVRKELVNKYDLAESTIWNIIGKCKKGE